jgi:hypothetical protein
LTQENNQLFGGLLPDLKLEQEIEESLITQVHKYEDTINTQNITGENTIEEIIVPVVTHNTQAHQESDHYLIIQSVNTEGPYKMKNSLNQEWATESMFPELQEGPQDSEDPFQAHNPFEVTGQVTNSKKYLSPCELKFIYAEKTKKKLRETSPKK